MAAIVRRTAIRRSVDVDWEDEIDSRCRRRRIHDWRRCVIHVRNDVGLPSPVSVIMVVCVMPVVAANGVRGSQTEDRGEADKRYSPGSYSGPRPLHGGCLPVHWVAPSMIPPSSLSDMLAEYRIGTLFLCVGHAVVQRLKHGNELVDSIRVRIDNGAVRVELVNG